ncbi:MAG: DUF885 domain-containing protein [Woeseiaceae bacterium]|nr:DUF885 domain-containing protein [Woeseiaceae bacterium]
MKKSLIVGICLVIITACGGSNGNGGGQPPPPPAAGTPGADQLAADLQGLSLDDFYRVSIEALVRRSPETIIWRSLDDDYPLAVAQLDNLSDEYQRDTFAMYRVALDALRGYDRSILDADGQLNYDIYEWYLQDVANGLPFIYHGFVATYGIFGTQRGTEQLFTEVHPLETLQDAENYVTRLGLVETKFRQLAEHVARQRQNGIVEPALTLQIAIDQVSAMAQMAAAQSPYYREIADRIGSIPGITQAQRDDLLGRALAAVDGSVRRGYQDLLETMNNVASAAPAQIGVGQYPSGAQYYRHVLRHHTTTDMTPAEIHQLGLDELVRIHAEMRVIFDQLGYPQNETLPQLFSRVAADGGIIPAANVQATYEAIIELAEQEAPAAFDIFPSSDVIVIGDPAGGGYYIGPSKDGTRPGAFYAGTSYDQPWFPMRSLAYHETIPGHHTQIAIAMDQDLPMIRQVPRSTGFIEGWALYTERLAWELGWHDDPYSDLGRLQYEALRAARLVMDTGIHDLGWSFDQAVQFNRDNVGASVGASQYASARYSVYPGQATAYLVGMLQILDERQRAMDALGPQFDLKAFHRALLTNGSVPLEFLDDVVDRYIAEAQAGN